MTDDVLGALPFVHHRPLEQLTPPVQPPAPAAEHLAADPEQARAVDAVFTQDPESAALAGLMAVWTSSILLADLAKEHFHMPEDTEPARLEQPRLPNPPQT